MDASNQDPTAAGITQCTEYYCDKAMENLKAGRFKETYLYANEALELDGKTTKAAAIYRYVLYILHPKKRLLYKARNLQEQADRCINERDHDKAFELLSLAKKWHCTPGILWVRSNLNWGRKCFDLAYLDATEALAGCKEDYLFDRQMFCLRYLGYKLLPVIGYEQQRVDELPAAHPITNWPMGLRIKFMDISLQKGRAEVKLMSGATLEPYIPFDQLARFLNDHVQGAVEDLCLRSGNDEGMVLRLLDEVTVPGRLHTSMLIFTDFFHLPWAGIERILDGRTLRANTINLTRLQLPSGVDPNKLLELLSIRECTMLVLLVHTKSLPQLPGPPPLFKNTALVEWLKQSDRHELIVASCYLSSGLLSFLDALKKDFQQATQAHSYKANILCPHTNVGAGLGVRNERLFNRLGEDMWIVVEEGAGRHCGLLVVRFPPS